VRATSEVNLRYDNQLGCGKNISSKSVTELACAAVGALLSLAVVRIVDADDMDRNSGNYHRHIPNKGTGEPSETSANLALIYLTGSGNK